MTRILRSPWIFFTSIFICFVIYFTIAHPLVPFCTDDWINVNIARPFYPSIYSWNPTKIFPESLEPIVSMFAAYILYPIIGDYTYSLIFVNAVTVSLFIILYLYSFYRLLNHFFKTSQFGGFCITIIFALFHFLILKVQDSDNDFLWHATDCNCYYHYIIPTLFCASLVMWFMRSQVDLKSMDNVSLSILFLSLYLALFSNLYSSVILIAYVGARLCINLISFDKKRKRWVNDFCSENRILLIITTVWLIIQLFEVNGIRANAYGHLEDPFIDSLLLTINNYLHLQYNKLFLLITIACLLLAVVFVIIEKKKKQNTIFSKYFLLIVLSLFLSISYLLLLSSKVDAENVTKGNIIFAFAFYYLLLSGLCMGYIINKNQQSQMFFPILLFLIIFNLNSRTRTFKNILCEFGYDTKSYVEFNQKIIDQVCDADAKNQKQVTIRVPSFERPGKYPLSDDCSNFVGFTLYKHNIIKNRILTSFSTSEIAKDNNK